jgi:anti-anti-sigma factor
MHSVPAFHQLLEAEVQRAERGLIVALADITCMDSSGLAVLIEGLKWSRGRALPYVLTHVTPAVQRVLELARLEHLFPIAPSVEEAERQCTRPVHAPPPPVRQRVTPATDADKAPGLLAVGALDAGEVS